jgi:hypothetical protein
MIDDGHIQHAATELVERHGANAVTFAQERVEQLTASGDRKALDTALRLLSAVEELVEN